jgi:hypothetical protein
MFVALALVGAADTAAAEGHRGHFVRANAEGGVAAGQNGGVVARRRVTRTDGAGDVSTAGGVVFRNADGARGVRAGTTTRNADGSIAHRSGISASGAKGSVQSEGSYNRNADGSASGERTTSATGANGNTYNGSTVYTKGEGATHTGTCADASGNIIPCKR